MCGKLIRPNKDVMNRINEAFEALKAPYHRTSSTVTRGDGCGPNPWQQHHHKARDALRSATKGERTFTSIWDRWQHGEIHRKSQLPHDWSDARVRYLDHIAQYDISHNAPQWQRERYVNLIHLRSLDSNKQGEPLWKRPGYQQAKRELANLQKSEGQVQVPYIPVSDSKLDPSGEALCGTAKSRTPITIIIFKLVTKPEMVEFVFSGPKLAKMALAWVARRQMVRPMVKKDIFEFMLRLAVGNSFGVSEQFNVVKVNL